MRDTASDGNGRTSPDVIVIGGGQAGLAMGFELAQRGVSFLILEAHDRIGDSWRTRWDSLRLFTPARYDSLPGMPFPAPAFAFPTKDQMADYLEAYAGRFGLPIQTSARVQRLSRSNAGGFVVETDDQRYEASQVVVAMSGFQRPRVPSFATSIAPGITQATAFDYRNPSNLQQGDVLIVGTGNSGAEIALELAKHHTVWLSGRDAGQVPFRIEGLLARLLVPVIFRVVFHRVLTIRTPMGKRARKHMLTKGAPRVRVKRDDLVAAGVRFVPKVAGVREGLPILEDGHVLDVKNVIWCTGYNAGFSWINIDVHGPVEPRHEAGVVPEIPGLYFLGLTFLYAGSSAMVHGVPRDAARLADLLARRVAAAPRAPAAARAELDA